MIKLWKALITVIQAFGMWALFGSKQAAIMLGLYKMYLTETKTLAKSVQTMHNEFQKAEGKT